MAGLAAGSTQSPMTQSVHCRAEESSAFARFDAPPGRQMCKPQQKHELNWGPCCNTSRLKAAGFILAQMFGEA
jgi:hypothetical protein